MKTSLSRTLVKPLLLALLICLAVTTTASAITVKEGETAPDFEITTLAGEPVKLADYRGKVVLLAFWASWCPRCMEELAFLQGLYTGFKDQLTVLAINQDTKNLSESHLAKLQKDVNEMGLEFPVLVDLEFDAWQKYGINALPTSIIVDTDGKVVFAEPNYYWASQKKIKNVLAGLGIGKPVEE